MPFKIDRDFIIHDIDKDGDVEIEAIHENVSSYLDQEKIKKLIEFLQKQLTHNK